MKDSKNSKRPSRKRKGYRTNKREEAETVDTSRATERKNAIQWYSHNPALLADAGKLPFAQSLGTEMHVAATEVASATDEVPTPGLMVLRYIPTPGYAPTVGRGVTQAMPYKTDGMYAPVNVAGREIYSFTRHANSGAKNYDSPNLMMYLLCMDSVYMFYSMCVRIYGTLRLFSGRNRYLPRALSHAFGVDYDDLSSNMAQFRAMINMFAAKASSMYVPAVMDFYTRHFWLTQNLFMDGQTAKAQIYAYAPLHLWKFGGTMANGLPYMNPTETFTSGKGLKLEDLRRIGDSMLTPLVTSEDFNLMSGDILKAYGSDKLFVLQPIPEDYVVFPVYEEEVLMQIHNSTSYRVDDYKIEGTQGWANHVFTDSPTAPGWTIAEMLTTKTQTPLTSNFISTAFIELMATAYTGGTTKFVGATPALLTRPQILNAHKDNVTPEDVMEMTRLMSAAVFTDQNAGGTSKFIVPAAVGTEILVGYQVLTANYGSGGQQFDTLTFGSVLNEDEYTANDILTIAQKLAMFNFAPIVYTSDKFADCETASPYTPIPVVQTGRIGDMENYTVIDYETLKRLHEVALLSLFNIPEYGKF